MILDRVENIKTYLGISPALDMAIKALASLDLNEELPERAEIADGVRYTVSEIVQHACKGTLEYHRKYIDIHVPLTEGETIGFTSICAAEAPGYNEEQDYGLLEAADAQQITLPAGWFCLCFPDDAHEPSVGEAGKTYRKMVWKIRV